MKRLFPPTAISMHRSHTRREFLRAAGAAGAGALLLRRACVGAEAGARRNGLGLVTYCLGIHARDNPVLKEPSGFLEACRLRGAAGMQFPLGIRDAAAMRELRGTAEKHGLYIEAILELPGTDAALDRFEREVATARAAGAAVARTVMLPGRRYEQFKTRVDFEQACAAGLQALQRAEPVAARHKFRLAVENHKDHLVAEKIEVLKKIGSEYVGLCVDVVNNFALLEDPLETARAFAPYAMTVHLKDQGIRESEDGFWLSDEALGAGFLDLPAIVGILRQAKPDVRFNLEVITRDPIKVPVRTEQYWATFPGRPRSAMDPMLKLVREKGSAKQTMVSRRPQAEQLELERHNVKESLNYAQEKLKL